MTTATKVINISNKGKDVAVSSKSYDWEWEGFGNKTSEQKNVLRRSSGFQRGMLRCIADKQKPSDRKQQLHSYETTLTFQLMKSLRTKNMDR